MALMNIYDINARANQLVEEFIKLDGDEPVDDRKLLFDQMQLLATNNRTMFKLQLDQCQVEKVHTNNTTYLT